MNRNSPSGRTHGNVARLPVLSHRQPLPAPLRMIRAWEWKLPPLLGTSLPVLQLPRALRPAARTAPLRTASSRFRGHEPSPFRCNKQQICAPKKVSLHLPLEEVIMLMLSTTLVSSNTLALPCIPGSLLHVWEGRRISPCDREGRKQIRAALQSAARCFEEMGGGTSSCKKLPFDPHCFSHRYQWPLSRVS